MPDKDILAYYNAVAPKIIPFLRGRRVAVRHHFPDAVVFRRHRTVGRRKTWITISTKRELLEIVRQHGYEFFPHLAGRRNLWFALDIDLRAVPLPLGKRVVREAVRVFEERHVRFLLTFSGGNGFHFRWAFALPRAKAAPRGQWLLLRRIVRALQEEVEHRLQQAGVRRRFAAVVPEGDPITECNAMDRRAQSSVLFDELILKPQGTIRAPFSLHLPGRLVAIPVPPARIEAFDPVVHASLRAALAHPPVRLPRNSVSRFLAPPWS